MFKKNHTREMVATKNKHKVVSCSTPEHQADSPSRDSDSICDSEAASPVPFFCTQDGAEGETDVVWNFYTPKSENTATSRVKNTTPLSRKTKRTFQPKVIEKQLPKRRAIKISQKNTELFQDLLELNKNLHELISKKQNTLPEKPQSGSEEDVFPETQESPKCIPRNSSRCLRKNVLSSNFGRPDADAALESDDSMNECLLKASQIVEEKILNCEPTPAKRTRQSYRMNYTDKAFKMDQDSMDAILNSIKLESPIGKIKKSDSPCINNDSFDNFVGNLNDSALEQLTQMPIKSNVSNNLRSKDWTVKEVVVHDMSPSSKSFFGRHSSMPESPSVPDCNKPSSSGMAFGRYNSMPFDNQAENNESGDSPIRCTQDEIKKKHQLARERLLAKRMLPFTSSPQTQLVSTQLYQPIMPKKTQFQPKVASNQAPVPTTNGYNLRNNANSAPVSNESKNMTNGNTNNLKSLIEKKRQEAIMKLRRRQPQSK